MLLVLLLLLRLPRSAAPATACHRLLRLLRLDTAMPDRSSLCPPPYKLKPPPSRGAQKKLAVSRAPRLAQPTAQLDLPHVCPSPLTGGAGETAFVGISVRRRLRAGARAERVAMPDASPDLQNLSEFCIVCAVAGRYWSGC